MSIHLYLRAVAIDGLHLVVFRCQGAVAHHDAVHAESMQVGLVTEVSAVEHFLHRLASCLFLHDDSLVHPVPDEAAEHPRMAVDFIPILFEVAEGIAHTMGIFTGQHGTRTTVGTYPCTVVTIALGNL